MQRRKEGENKLLYAYHLIIHTRYENNLKTKEKMKEYSRRFHESAFQSAAEESLTLLLHYNERYREKSEKCL